MKRIAVLISSVLLITGLTFAQQPQKKEEKSAKKETKTEMTTKVVHHCNPNGTTCVCGNNCKEGCCVTVADTKKPAAKETKSTTTKKDTKESKPKKEENPPK